MTTLIEPTTDAVVGGESQVFIVRGSEPVALSADALDGSETVTVEYSGNGGTAWADESSAMLSASTPAMLIEGPGSYRVSKSATASACGVHVNY